MTTNQTPVAPFAELAAGACDYDLTLWLSANVDHYPAGLAGDVPPTVSRNYVLEASRSNGAWNLRVSPWSGDMADDGAGDPLLERRDQDAATDPLTLLRALLGGQTESDHRPVLP